MKALFLATAGASVAAMCYLVRAFGGSDADWYCYLILALGIILALSVGAFFGNIIQSFLKWNVMVAAITSAAAYITVIIGATTDGKFGEICAAICNGATRIFGNSTATEVFVLFLVGGIFIGMETWEPRKKRKKEQDGG